MAGLQAQCFARLDVPSLHHALPRHRHRPPTRTDRGPARALVGTWLILPRDHERAGGRASERAGRARARGHAGASDPDRPCTISNVIEPYGRSSWYIDTGHKALCPVSLARLKPGILRRNGRVQAYYGRSTGTLVHSRARGRALHYSFPPSLRITTLGASLTLRTGVLIPLAR